MAEPKNDYTCPNCGSELIEVQGEEPETPGCCMETGIYPKCQIFLERESLPVVWKPWQRTPAWKLDDPAME